jgi:hypothetical protein
VSRHSIANAAKRDTYPAALGLWDAYPAALVLGLSHILRLWSGSGRYAYPAALGSGDAYPAALGVVYFLPGYCGAVDFYGMIAVLPEFIVLDFGVEFACVFEAIEHPFSPAFGLFFYVLCNLF